MKIGIFGGTFNPPHVGHINAAKAAKEAMCLDRLIFLPSNIPPHKALPEKTATKEQRLYMTHIAAESMESEVSAIELMREGKSYTVDTIKYFKEKYPDDELYFIMGTDMLLTFLNWYQPEEIVKYCHIVALSREEELRDKMEVMAEEIRGKLGAKVYVIDNKVTKASSSQVRSGVQNLILRDVKKYIEENHLYINEKDN